MNIFKVSILSLISTSISVASNFIITKIVAVYIGPSGLAIIGQLQNFISIALLTCGGFLRTALIKFTAESKNESLEQQQLWSAVLKVSLFLWVIISFGILVFHHKLSLYILGSDIYSDAFLIFIPCLLLFILNTFFVSALNGLKEIKDFIKINIAMSIISLVWISVLSLYYGLYGCIIAYISSQSISFVYVFFRARRFSWFRPQLLKVKNVKQDYLTVLQFSLITLTSVLASNVSLMIVRDYIISNYSGVDAGYWQGVWSLSQVSLSIVTLSLSTYLLPALSSSKMISDLHREVSKTLKVVVPLSIIISIGIYLFRDQIIILLFSNEFVLMRDLFLWQMLGNIIKSVGWVYGSVLVARGQIKYTTSTEVFFAFLWVVLSIKLIIMFGVIGATYSYFIVACCHAVTMIFICYRRMYR
ncbi:O-antigen translocase [Vibrio metschnikovii]|uniref:O-antigen translocase n=1 Tax=Vibrio metschnikovii TaxID=28172 RepID=UPI001302358F|nr:O-antigen translocase [Vibrio metschnikovii]